MGESLVDVVRRPDGTREEHAGGSPANVAVGLGRAGLDVSLATALGDDHFGALIRDHLETSGVQLLTATTDHTSSAVATLDDDGSATYDFDVVWDPGSFDLETGPDAVHTGSIGASLEPGAADVESLVRRLAPSAVVSFDPNARPAVLPDRDTVVPRAERLVALADIVKVSDEDLAWLFPAEPVDAVASRWLAAGPSLVVVTRGADGSTALARSGTVTIPVVTTDVVDTVGAGDAFMAGLLAALDREGLLTTDRRDALRAIDPETVRRVAATAALAASIVVGRAGAQPAWSAELWTEM